MFLSSGTSHQPLLGLRKSWLGVLLVAPDYPSDPGQALADRVVRLHRFGADRLGQPFVLLVLQWMIYDMTNLDYQ